MDSKAQQTLLLAVYKENATHARHHESQRVKITGIVAQTAGVVIGLFSLDKLSAGIQVPGLCYLVGVLLVGFGGLGFMICWQHNEQARLHQKRAGKAQKSLQKLSGVDLEQLNNEADAEHRRDYQTLNSPNFRWLWRLLVVDWGWKLLHLLVVVFGFSLLFMPHFYPRSPGGTQEVSAETSAKTSQPPTTHPPESRTTSRPTTAPPTAPMSGR